MVATPLRLLLLGTMWTIAAGYTIGLLTLLIGAKQFRRDPTGKPTPTVALVIPTYNEAAVIRRKLENVSQLDYPRDRLRVLVVDGASTDDTAGLVRKFITENDGILACSLVERPERMGKSAAINEAIHHVDSEILALTDADVTFPPASLYELTSGFQNPSIGAVSGVEIPVNGSNAVDEIEGEYRRIYTAIRMAEASIDSPFMCESELSAYRRELLQPLRPDTMGDDVELTIGVRSKGFRGEYDLHASFFEVEAGTFRSKFRQKFRRGMAIQQALLRNRKVLFNRTYGKYGTRVFPFEFFSHLVSPVLLVVALSFAVAIAATQPWSLLFLSLEAVLSAIPSLIIVQLLIRKYTSTELSKVSRTGSWIFGAVAFFLFQGALLASLIRLLIKGPIVKWPQIPEARLVSPLATTR